MERNPKNNKRRVFNDYKEVDPESFFLTSINVGPTFILDYRVIS